MCVLVVLSFILFEIKELIGLAKELIGFGSSSFVQQSKGHVSCVTMQLG